MRIKIQKILETGTAGVDIDLQVCMEWIEGLKKKDVEKTELEVDLESFRKFIKKAKESQRASPSGRHYGHYKVLEQDDELVKLVFEVIQVVLETGVVLKTVGESTSDTSLKRLTKSKDPPIPEYNIGRG